MTLNLLKIFFYKDKKKKVRDNVEYIEQIKKDMSSPFNWHDSNRVTFFNDLGIP
jgi:hypothetical protein